MKQRVLYKIPLMKILQDLSFLYVYYYYKKVMLFTCNKPFLVAYAHSV